MIVAPATYNTMAKCALGISDTYALGILAEAVSLPIPVVVLPFVNSALASRAPFQRAVHHLRDEGVRVLLGPGEFEPHPPGTGGQQIDVFPWQLARDEAERLIHNELREGDPATAHPATALHCRIEPFIDQDGTAVRHRWPRRQRRAWPCGRPARRTPSRTTAERARSNRSHVMRAGTALSRLPRLRLSSSWLPGQCRLSASLRDRLRRAFDPAATHTDPGVLEKDGRE